jgi:hypothetical protein
VLIRWEVLEPNSINSLFLFVQAGGIVAWGVFLVGLAAVFRELSEELRVLYHRTEQSEAAR